MSNDDIMQDLADRWRGMFELLAEWPDGYGPHDAEALCQTIERQADTIARLTRERDESSEVADLYVSLVQRTARAIGIPEVDEDGAIPSLHDLPERVAAVVTERDDALVKIDRWRDTATNALHERGMTDEEIEGLDPVSVLAACVPAEKATMAHAERVEQERDDALARATRYHDLVRQMRQELHEAGLITAEEYATLAEDSGGARRLEGYDAMRARAEKAEATITAILHALKDHEYGTDNPAATVETLIEQAETAEASWSELNARVYAAGEKAIGRETSGWSQPAILDELVKRSDERRVALADLDVARAVDSEHLARAEKAEAERDEALLALDGAATLLADAGRYAAEPEGAISRVRIATVLQDLEAAVDAVERKPDGTTQEARGRLAAALDAGDWYCPGCGDYLCAERVTFDERCDTCGAEVEWVDADDPEAPEGRAEKAGAKLATRRNGGEVPND